MIRSNDYHDYFIKDGKLVGAFEEMYQNCPDPWWQDVPRGLEEDIALLMLKDYSYRRVLDLGCGKGRFSGRLQKATQAHVVGVDIAPTAIRAAQARFPSINFMVSSAASLSVPDSTFDLVVSAHLLWSIIPDLSKVFSEVSRVLKPGGHYLIMQTYYLPGRQQYASEVMTSPDDLLRLLPFQPLHTVELNRAREPRFIVLAHCLP